MVLDADQCYRRLSARDARYDGVFFVGVSSTGIYCRPICPARTPRRDRCHFFANVAAAERQGFRPCLRCRPELAPGHASVDAVGRLARIAVARIETGAMNEGSFEQLAQELDISSRQLRRAIDREYGVAPVQLAQTQRLLLAKRLLTDTQVKIADVAFASGFSSLRRFNHLFRTRYGLNPGALRRRESEHLPDDVVRLKLVYRPPLDWLALLAFLGGRGAAGVEAVQDGRYLRSVRLGAHTGWIAVAPLATESALSVEMATSLLPVLTPLLAHLRRLFDLDANPLVIGEHLACDVRLRTQIQRHPGLRVPGTFDGFELALRAVLGQQVSVKAATTIHGRFVQAYGEAIETPHPQLTHTAPAAERIAAQSLAQIAALGLPRSRANAVLALARAVTQQGLKLEPETGGEETLARLKALPGIGDWTAQYVAMRALHDADAFPATDLGVLRALNVGKTQQATAIAQNWRPWRAYAVMYLWMQYAGG